MQTGQQTQEEGVTHHVLPGTSSATTTLNVVVVHSPPFDMPQALSLAPSSTPLPSSPVRCPPDLSPAPTSVIKRLESIHQHCAGAKWAQPVRPNAWFSAVKLTISPVKWETMLCAYSTCWQGQKRTRNILGLIFLIIYLSEMVSWKDISPGISFNCVHRNFFQKQMWDKVRHCHSMKQLPNSQGEGVKNSQKAIVEPKGVKQINISDLREKWSVITVVTHMFRATISKYILVIFWYCTWNMVNIE